MARSTYGLSWHQNKKIKDELNEKPVILRDDSRLFSGEVLTNECWTSHLLLEELTGRMLTAKVHVFSNSESCTCPDALDPTSISGIGEKKAEAVVKSDTCKKRKRRCRSTN